MPVCLLSPSVLLFPVSLSLHQYISMIGSLKKIMVCRNYFVLEWNLNWSVTSSNIGEKEKSPSDSKKAKRPKFEVGTGVLIPDEIYMLCSFQLVHLSSFFLSSLWVVFTKKKVQESLLRNSVPIAPATDRFPELSHRIPSSIQGKTLLEKGTVLCCQWRDCWLLLRNYTGVWPGFAWPLPCQPRHSCHEVYNSGWTTHQNGMYSANPSEHPPNVAEWGYCRVPQPHWGKWLGRGLFNLHCLPSQFGTFHCRAPTGNRWYVIRFTSLILLSCHLLQDV